MSDSSRHAVDVPCSSSPLDEERSAIPALFVPTSLACNWVTTQINPAYFLCLQFGVREKMAHCCAKINLPKEHCALGEK